jgi:hypothetical protein
VIGVPMMNEPFGTTTISGQPSHSLKLSFGRSACTISGVSGCTPFAAKNCRGGDADGVCMVCADGARLSVVGLDLADAAPASEIASRPAASAASSFKAAVIDDPWRGRQQGLVARGRDFVRHQCQILCVPAPASAGRLPETGHPKTLDRAIACAIVPFQRCASLKSPS